MKNVGFDELTIPTFIIIMHVSEIKKDPANKVRVNFEIRLHETE